MVLKTRCTSKQNRPHWMQFRRWHLVLQFDHMQFIIWVHTHTHAHTTLDILEIGLFVFLIAVAAASTFVFLKCAAQAAASAIVRNRRATHLTKEIDFRDWNIQPVSSICLDSGVQRYLFIYLFLLLLLLLLFHFREREKWSGQVVEKQQLLLKLLWENAKKMCVAKSPIDRLLLTVSTFVLVSNKFTNRRRRRRLVGGIRHCLVMQSRPVDISPNTHHHLKTPSNEL